MSNSGVLGSRNLISEVNQAVYVNNYSDISAITLSVCNKHYIETNISVAVSTSATSPSNSEWIEYETILTGKGVLERSGILVTPGQYIVVKSSGANVNVVAWGTELGTLSVTPTVITTNTSGSGPTFVGPTEFTVFAGDAS